MLKKISSYIVVLVIGGALGTYFDAAHTIEEKIVTKDRTRTIIKEVITERPDGSKVTERVTDRKEKTDTKQSKKESIPSSKNWAVGVKYDLGSVVPVWSVDINRRVIGNLYVGLAGRTDGVISAGLLYTF